MSVLYNCMLIKLINNGGIELSLLSIIMRLSIATLTGMLLGMEREKNHKPAGFKTHALVSLGAALIAIIEIEVTNEVLSMAGAGIEGVTMARGRIVCQVVSGIGFLGAGCILHKDNFVAGITTAATIWVSAGIGLACGFGYYKIVAAAVVLAFSVLIVPRVFMRIIRKRRLNGQKLQKNKGEK